MASSKTTVVNVRGKKSGYVYVGRAAGRGRYKASAWGNPFKVTEDQDIHEVLLRYLMHLLDSPKLLAKLPSLRGKALGCWCVDDPDPAATDPGDYCCHAQVLAALADGPLGEPRD
ncbi:MAG: DUF4326 domain-containing protein [Gemmataceae bacterium]